MSALAKIPPSPSSRESFRCLNFLQEMISKVVKAVTDCFRYLFPCLFSEAKPSEIENPHRLEVGRVRSSSPVQEEVTSPRSVSSDSSYGAGSEEEVRQIDMTASLVSVAVERASSSKPTRQVWGSSRGLSEISSSKCVALQIMESIEDQVLNDEKILKDELDQWIVHGEDIYRHAADKNLQELKDILEFYPSLEICDLAVQNKAISQLSSPTLVLDEDDRTPIGNKYAMGIEKKFAALQATASARNDKLVAGILSIKTQEQLYHYGVMVKFAGRGPKYHFYLINPCGKEKVVVHKFPNLPSLKNYFLTIAPGKQDLNLQYEMHALAYVEKE